MALKIQDGLVKDGDNFVHEAALPTVPSTPTAFTQTFDTTATTVPTQTAAALVHTAVAGTTDGTLVDCTVTYSETAVEENFKELATAYNALRVDHLETVKVLNKVLDILQAAGFAA